MTSRILRFSMICAVLAFITAGIVCIPVFNSLHAQSDDMLVLGRDDATLVSGTVIDVERGSFTVLSGNQTVNVSTDDMDLDESIENLLGVGTHVTVEGELENNVLEAERIVQIGDARFD